MRYITYNLTYPTPQYGYGPEPIAHAQGSKLVASNFATDIGLHLGYLDGDINLVLLNDWSANELTQIQALTFAKSINSEAFLGDDGIIKTPFIDI